MSRYKIINYTPAIDKLQEIEVGYQIVRINLAQNKCVVRVKANVNATQAEPIYSESEMLQYLRNNLLQWENEI